MPRPSKNQDVLLIQQAVRLMPKKGISSLNIREIARHAGVGLGMFTYHFKSKKEFTKRVLESVYEKFFQQLQYDLKDEPDPKKRLRKAGLYLARFSRDHRALLCSLLQDVMNGNREASSFFAANVGRHLSILQGIIIEGQKAGVIKQAPVDLVLGFFATGINFPNIATEIVMRAAPKSSVKGLKTWQSNLVSDEALLKRVEWAIEAVSA